MLQALNDSELQLVASENDLVSLKGGWPLYAVSTTTEGKKLTSKTKDALVQQATLLGIEVANHTKEILAFKILVQTGSLDWDRDSATRSAKEVQ
mmetsp:Transcript_19240/g.72663  ORF Transcript_19240/g.72663 Transcript_19240/m.72663 type:complete len:94 (+) Transcript_19240:391-672(+)